jgi:hypothetical protein
MGLGLMIRGVCGRESQVQEEVSAAMAMLGFDGFVLLAVSQQNGELEQGIETPSREDFCALRGAGTVA